jgi:hypothetical protein
MANEAKMKCSPLLVLATKADVMEVAYLCLFSPIQLKLLFDILTHSSYKCFFSQTNVIVICVFLYEGKLYHAREI